MIPVSFREEEEKTVNNLYHKLLNIKKHQPNKTAYISNIKAINIWCEKNIVIDGKSYSFPQVIQADYDTLLKIVQILNSGVIFPKKYEHFMKDTLYKNRFPRREFMESLGVTVCPYCNRNFVNKADRRTMCDLDHFFNKDLYPVLAVSFYNLIPVCHSCNHSKGVQSISYSPHDKRYSTDELLTFDFYLKGINFLYDEKDIGVEITEIGKMKKNVKALSLGEVYQIHTDIVQDCIKRTMMFSPEYLNYLYDSYGNLFESEDELYRTVFGNYIKEKEYGKRPLSKLTADIIKKLFEICYGVDL